MYHNEGFCNVSYCKLLHIDGIRMTLALPYCNTLPIAERNRLNVVLYYFYIDIGSGVLLQNSFRNDHTLGIIET